MRGAETGAAEMAEPVLEINVVSKRYSKKTGTVAALESVSLRIGKGVFAVVCGPSGSGKTTLLLAAGGLLKPDSGAIKVKGAELYALPPEQRAAFRAANIGFVFQQFHLIPYLDVLQNVAAAAIAAAVPAADAEARAMELLSAFGMEARATHFPPELSTGERQRVALARALFHRPCLLLADEPTGNLDERNAQSALEYMRRFASEGGAVLMATHNTALAADERFRLEAGKLRA